jgi:8-oxo-dGTP pyrophosphatase MutT (NUDIX family)
MSKWQRLSGAIVYQNDHISVHEDQVISPDGRAVSYGWVEAPPAVFIVAVNEKDEVCLVEQERYTTGNLSWEIPAGGTDGADELDAAKRELAEEADLHADNWERLPGDMHPLNGLAAERDIIYIATGLHHPRASIKGDEVITGRRWVSWKELRDMLVSGEITDCQTIAAVAKAGIKLGQLK